MYRARKGPVSQIRTSTRHRPNEPVQLAPLGYPGWFLERVQRENDAARSIPMRTR